MENLEDMATIMTYESGKPLVESRGEVVYGTSFLEYYAAEALRPTSTGGGYSYPLPLFIHHHHHRRPSKKDRGGCVADHILLSLLLPPPVDVYYPSTRPWVFVG